MKIKDVILLFEGRPIIAYSIEMALVTGLRVTRAIEKGVPLVWNLVL